MRTKSQFELNPCDPDIHLSKHQISVSPESRKMNQEGEIYS